MSHLGQWSLGTQQILSRITRGRGKNRVRTPSPKQVAYRGARKRGLRTYRMIVRRPARIAPDASDPLRARTLGTRQQRFLCLFAFLSATVRRKSRLCLASLTSFSEVVVVDSRSSDATADIAQQEVAKSSNSTGTVAFPKSETGRCETANLGMPRFSSLTRTSEQRLHL